MDRQGVIDFDRASQLALLRDCRLDRLAVVEGGRPVGVSGAAARLVLRVIDDYGRGREAWPSFETLAGTAGLSVRQVKRVVGALVAASLLIVECRSTRWGRVNHYRIVWSELALLCRPAGGGPGGRDRGEGEGGGRAMVARGSCHGGTTGRAMVAGRSCHDGTTGRAMVAHKPPKESQIEPPTEPPAPPVGGGEWSAVVDEWKGRIGQAAELAASAAAAGESPAAWSARVSAAWQTATAGQNRALLRSPAGAVVAFLRSGSWPCAGVVEAGEAAARAARRAADGRARDAAAVAFQVIRRGRRAGASDDDLRAALVAAGPGVLEASGW